jgi:hypothetical protein
VVDIFLPVRFYWIRRARWLKLHGFRADATDAEVEAVLAARAAAAALTETAPAEPAAIQA